MSMSAPVPPPDRDSDSSAPPHETCYHGAIHWAAATAHEDRHALRGQAMLPGGLTRGSPAEPTPARHRLSKPLMMDHENIMIRSLSTLFSAIREVF